MKVLLCMVSLMVLLECHQIKGCLQSEREGLLQIKSYFDSRSDPRYVSDFLSWSVGVKSNCCEWERVGCSPFTGRVTDLFLDGTLWSNKSGFSWIINMTLFHSFYELRTLDLSSNFIGSLVENRGFNILKNLQNVDLRDNVLNSLPNFLINLSSLEVLDLSMAGLTGELDASICRLKNIRELYFSFNKLNGSLPTCLWNLTSLQALILSDNSVSGRLTSIINLPSLQFLSISDNNFVGKFTFNSLKNHSSLEVLVLSNNNLQVEIDETHPSTLQFQVLGLANCNLNMQTKTLQKFLFFQSNLQFLDLSNNSLTGSFPTWLLQNNSNLHILYIGNNSLTGSLHLPPQKNFSVSSLMTSHNQLSGEVPNHIGMTLSRLIFLQMSNNYFHGPIPSSLSNITRLHALDLSHNKLSGEVPNRLFSYCSNLEVLVLSNNNLDGEIIPRNMNLSSLELLSLYNNHFFGAIKESLKLSTSLIFLDIANNNGKGELPNWIGSLKNLETLSLAKNYFHGNIPSQACSLYFLKYLDLSENRFTGEIPSFITPNLKLLHLNGNDLIGAIPKGLIGCSHLRVLDLASNRLSGSVPTWIYEFRNLTILRLGDNDLQGELPAELCQLQHLNIIDLSDNGISGVIPSCFRNLSFGALEGDNVFFTIMEGSFIYIIFKTHFFFLGTIRTYDFKLYELDFIVKNIHGFYNGNIIPMMSILDLSRNQLTGYIPPELGALTSLYNLNLSHNLLFGPIPESFSNLKGIESLDLSNNNLSGMIPLQLVNLNFLEVFNVSYNNLSGEVPETGQFGGSFDETSYLGNPLLCGLLLPKKCNINEPPSSSSTEWRDEGNNTFDLEVFFWSFGASYIIVLLTIFLILYINSNWCRAWFAFIDYHLLWWFYK